MDPAWRPLTSSPRYRRGRLTLREDVWRLPDGRRVTYPVLVVGVTVGVLPFVDDGHVLLVRQYRHLQRAASWELPGGGAHADETPAAAAHRELREEGGYRAARLVLLTRFFPSNAYLDEVAPSDHQPGRLRTAQALAAAELLEARIDPMLIAATVVRGTLSATM